MSENEQIIRQAAPHSVEVSVNAKGEPSFSIKVYGDAAGVAADEAMAAARKLRDQLAIDFPKPVAPPAAPPTKAAK